MGVGLGLGYGFRCMLLANYRVRSVDAYSVNVHTSQCSSIRNQIAKRFFSVSFLNFARVCTQAIRSEFFVLLYYIFAAK